MQTVFRLILVPAALIATTALANADWPRSSARQPDFSTCSSSRHACVVGTARRGHSQAPCERAYKTCMRTGMWDTYGLYGRRLSGVAQR